MGGDELETRWALVVPHRERLLAIARRRCATAQDAEDCVQEAMVRAVAYPQLDANRAAALLTTITKRVATDQARRRGIELRGRPRLVTLPAQATAPDEAVVDQAEASWFAAQLERLPERERQVFEHRASGLSATETAHCLQLSYKSVESAFTRARHRLKVWAAAGALLLGDLVRRRRQQPAALAAVLAVSAGCLIASVPGGKTPRPAARSAVPPRILLMAGAEPPSGGEPAPARVVMSGRGLPQSGPPAPEHAASGAPSSGPASPPAVYVRTPPVNNPTKPNGPPLLSYGFISTEGYQHPVEHFEYCLDHPMLGPDKYGCPET